MLEIAERLNWGGLLRSVIVSLLLAILVCGCGTMRYYRQAVSGQREILRQRQPIARLLADPAVSPELKDKFELIMRLREFAEAELRLPINRHYLTYVDLQRRFAVWNVHAARQFSLKPKTWWYPFVGSLKYRGFFKQSDARAYAARLEREGYDVHVEGVEAYSTLGWFADPLLNTFLHYPEPALAEIIFHELAHQRLFLAGDTDFNEAFATAVAEEGVRRWFLAKHDEVGYQQYLAELQQNRQFVRLVLDARRQLLELYQETDNGGPSMPRMKGPVPNWVRQEKARIVEELKSDHQALKASWGGYSTYDAWFSRPLNNAQLNTIAVYYELVPGFQALLRQREGELEAFYKAVRDLRKLSKEGRRRWLRWLGSQNKTGSLSIHDVRDVVKTVQSGAPAIPVVR